MRLKNFLFSLFLIGCLPGRLGAQEVLERTIVVDSVVVDSAVDPVDLRVFSVFDIKPDQIYSITQDSVFHSSGSPLTCHINFRKGNDLVVYMIVDDKGGRIELRGLEACSGTLHIPVWHIYKNQLIDAVSRTVSYYHHYGDSLVKKPFAERNWQTPPIYVYQDTLKQTNVTINDRHYNIPLTVAQPHSIVKVVDGYLSHSDEHRERKIFLSPDEKHRKLKFNTYSATIKTTFHSYSGFVDLRK